MQTYAIRRSLKENLSFRTRNNNAALDAALSVRELALCRPQRKNPGAGGDRQALAKEENLEIPAKPEGQ
ncbi:hypothetical protein [Herbaspirillum rubrisubalbicans]|uniref:hypothetical protein n=1 Tax=Herbaspirillum rubrisubalbicans TaxID=80842 RepID=UPI0015C5611A|nr:hypothetical protein [Herbaspirillum rubrisubalbicans]NQE47510.1 hypothetical protein [Herbaspirillum rubrisubalbicans]